MRPRHGMLALAAVLAAAWALAAPAGGAATASCSRATAARVLKAHGYQREPGTPLVGSVLCGSFTGAHSTAMVATVAHGVCWPVVGWAVLARRGGAWRLVARHNALFEYPFTPVAGGFRETQALFARGDTGCNPTGGARSRDWHWSGGRLVAGHWHRDPPGFLSPDRAVWCVAAGDGSIVCGTADGRHSGRVRVGAAPVLCNDQPGCIQDFDPHAPVLRAGRSDDLAGLRCTAAAASVTCVEASGRHPGRGFRITRDGAVRVA